MGLKTKNKSNEIIIGIYFAIISLIGVITIVIDNFINCLIDKIIKK